VALVEASFHAGSITIRIEASEDVRLIGFPNEYSQVLTNLLSNSKHAIQASRREPGLVIMRLAREEGMGTLTVTDNGGGVDEAFLDRIFDPYFSTDASGTGIGLYMSKLIIEQNMGGRITARNVEGGAEFSVQVPLAP
jgi:signal transduction histidine kinase